MIKLSDIIKSGGGNAKINRFINRYVLSKKEKKDIIDGIKEGGGSSSNDIVYYKSIVDELDNGYGRDLMDTLYSLSTIMHLGIYCDDWDYGNRLIGYNITFGEKHYNNRIIYGITVTKSKVINNGNIFELKSFEELFEIAKGNEEMEMVKSLFYQYLKLSTKEEIEASMPIIN